MKEIIEGLKKKYQIWFMLDDEYGEILIQKEQGENESMGDLKSYKIPKSVLKYVEDPGLKISAEDAKKIEELLEKKIISHLEAKSDYKNLSKEFSKVIKGVSFYATTYGLGTHIALNTEEEVRDRIRPVLESLDKGNVEYKLQYSEAMWVYKIVFSKSKENLKRLENLSKQGNKSPKM